MNVKLNRQQTIGMVAASVLVLTVLATTVQSQSQWEANGNNIYYNSGNVGIGTSSPTFKLHILGTSDNQMKLDNDGSTYTSLYWANNGTIKGQAYYNVSSNQFRFGGSGTNTVTVLTSNSDTERMRIDASGNVGIGTTSPANKLQVGLGAANNGVVASFGNDTRTDAIRLTIDSSSNGLIQLRQGSSGTVGALVSSAGESYFNGGSVGIGTTDPLRINGQNFGLAFQVSGNGMALTGTPEIIFNDNAQSANSRLMDLYSTGGKLLVRSFNDSGGSVVNIAAFDRSGNVGIGTTNPGAKLDVNGGIYSSGQIRANSLSLYFWGSDASGANRVLSGAPNVESQDTQGLELGTSSSAPLVLYTAATERMRIDSSGATTVAGNLTVSGNINAKYQDLAEWVESSEQLAAGTVVVLDSTKSNQVISSSQSYDTRVAGVISAQPGITLGEKGEGKVLVATTGRVKVKVDATKSPIQIGDLLVTSDVPGVAMKSQPVEFAGRKMHMPGTLIGKALEPLAKGKGEILVLLSLQ